MCARLPKFTLSVLSGIGLLGFFLIFTGQVFAADAAATTADLRPIWNYGVELLVAVLGVLGTWAISRLSAWLGLQQDNSTRAYLDDALTRALQYGAEVLLRQGADFAVFETRSQLVAIAANYVSGSVPDALRRFGIDSEGLRQRLQARLPEVVPHPAQPMAVGTLLGAP